MPLSSRFGVERVAVVCAIDPALKPAGLRADICRQLAASVTAQSGYPAVVVDTIGETQFTSDFLLQVEARRNGSALELSFSNPQIGRPKGSRGKPPRRLSVPVDANGGVPRLQEMTAQAVEYFLTSPARPARPKN